jgi:twinkle protein
MEEEQQPPLETHQPCPDCGSSDALSIYENNTYCFSCNQWKPIIEKGMNSMSAVHKTKSPLTSSDRLSFKAIKDRQIELDTCKKYNVKTGQINNKDVHVYPYYGKDGSHVINKIRIVDEKKFYSEGQRGSETTLFGQNLFSQGGKFITVCEGELDCLSAYQMLGSKWPVVSIRNGAASGMSEVKRNLDFLNTYQNVVLCFDADVYGQKAVKQIANLLEPGHCKIMSLNKKDANDYLMEGKSREFVNDFWNARVFTPEGIVCGPDLREKLLSEETIQSLPYPWDGLNAITYGMRKNELVLVTAGSGIGKSSVMRELIHYIISSTEEKVGCLFLEESVKQSGLGLLSVQASKRFHITSEGDRDWTIDDKIKALDELRNLEQVVFWNHFGSSTLDNLLTRVRYMVKGLDCQYIVLDHISMVIYETTNERKAIDDIMVKLRTLVQELGIHLIVVSHLSRPQGTGHEEGANISLNQLRGSHSLAQLPDMILALERNTQAVNEEERNRTCVRVLKNRFSGESGPAALLQWTKQSGRLTEIPFNLNDDDTNEDEEDEFTDDRDFS